MRQEWFEETIGWYLLPKDLDRRIVDVKEEYRRRVAELEVWSTGIRYRVPAFREIHLDRERLALSAKVRYRPCE